MTFHWCKCSLSGSQKPYGDWFRRCPGYSWRVVNFLLLLPFLLSASSPLLIFSPHYCSGIRMATEQMPFRFLCSVMLGNGPFLNPREVMPLAVLHFENTVLVASCAFLLELCGLSASMLRVDVAALRRISSFYKSTNYQV